MTWSDDPENDPLNLTLDDDGCLGQRIIVQDSSIDEVVKKQRDQAKYNNELLSGVEIKNFMMEKWINDVLADAEIFNIPGLLRRPEQKSGLVRYGLDRYSL